MLIIEYTQINGHSVISCFQILHFIEWIDKEHQLLLSFGIFSLYIGKEYSYEMEVSEFMFLQRKFLNLRYILKFEK
jgi:hypothetical protein